jgi:hypothetical protein
MAIVKYRQCKLQKGNSYQMSWIPEKFANIGKTVKLRDADGSWDDGWLVKEAFSVRTDSEIVDSHDAIKRHRKATGDSLPKMK